MEGYHEVTPKYGSHEGWVLTASLWEPAHREHGDWEGPEGQPQPLQCLTGLCLLQKQSVCSLFQEQCIQLRRQQEAHRHRAGTEVHSASTGLCKPPAPWQRLPGTYAVPAVSAQSTLDTVLFFLVPRWQMRGLLRHCLCQTSSLGRTALPRVWCHSFPRRRSSQLNALSHSPSPLAHRHLLLHPTPLGTSFLSLKAPADQGSLPSTPHHWKASAPTKYPLSPGPHALCPRVCQGSHDQARDSQPGAHDHKLIHP